MMSECCENCPYLFSNGACGFDIAQYDIEDLPPLCYPVEDLESMQGGDDE